ncbi:MAG: acyl-ACP--UDP-N-acetylglucosamine O-acyltransferase [Proteobacteria bacterium]|nr:acyl-ACP--UDP-N-acetylglucosamine O-acyltransferase [Pseudomonadota bacterium]
MIDARAIVDPSARLGEGVEIGPWSIVGPDVELGDGCQVGPHVIIKGPTIIGRHNRIFQFSSVGEDTPALAYHGEPTTLIIGDNNIIREGVTIHRGMVQDESTTVIGNDCLFMAYVHVGHDCVVGNNVIMANNASISGHVHVGDYANFGGYSGVPQHRRIGAHTHIAGMSLVLKDVPAYMTVGGNPASAIGLNIEGMRRRGFSEDLIKVLRDAHKTVYRKGLTVKEACSQLEDVAEQYPEVRLFVDSIQASSVGIIRPRGRSREE